MKLSDTERPYVQDKCVALECGGVKERDMLTEKDKCEALECGLVKERDMLTQKVSGGHKPQVTISGNEASYTRKNTTLVSKDTVRCTILMYSFS